MDSGITIKQAGTNVGKAFGTLGKVVLNVAKNTIIRVANDVKDKIVSTTQNIKNTINLGAQKIVSSALSKGINILNRYKDFKLQTKAKINLIKNTITSVPKNFITGFKEGYKEVIKEYENMYNKCGKAKSINGVKVKNHSNVNLKSTQKINQKSKLARTHKEHKIITFFKQLIAEMKRRKRQKEIEANKTITQSIDDSINNSVDISNVNILPNINVKTLNAVGVRKVNSAKNQITKTSATKKEKIKLKSQLKLALSIIAEQTKGKYYDVKINVGQKHKQIKTSVKTKINTFTNKIIETKNEIKSNIQTKINNFKNKVNTVKSKIVSVPTQTANKIKEKAQSMRQSLSSAVQVINVKERLKNSNIKKSEKTVQKSLMSERLEELRTSNTNKLNEYKALREEIKQIRLLSSEQTMSEDLGGMKLSRGYATTPQLIIFSGIIVTIVEFLIIIISILNH